MADESVLDLVSVDSQPKNIISNFDKNTSDKLDSIDINGLIDVWSKMLPHRPLVYFWVVEFCDGLALAQFKPESNFSEREFGDVIEKGLHTRISRSAWMPIAEQLALKVADHTPVISLKLPIHEIELDIKKDRLVLFRRNRLHYSGVSGRGKMEYALGIAQKEIKLINENGSYINSNDYPDKYWF